MLNYLYESYTDLTSQIIDPRKEKRKKKLLRSRHHGGLFREIILKTKLI